MLEQVIPIVWVQRKKKHREVDSENDCFEKLRKIKLWDFNDADKRLNSIACCVLWIKNRYEKLCWEVSKSIRIKISSEGLLFDFRFGNNYSRARVVYFEQINHSWDSRNIERLV